MAHSSSLDWDSLAPYWVSVHENFTTDDTLSVTEGGRKIQSIGGNNGNAAKGFVKGTARGAFKIQFKLGYVWGWSNLYVANVAAAVQAGGGNQYNNSSYNGISIINNSSNNAFRVTKWATGTSTQSVNVTGLNDVMVTLWRDTSNVVKVKYGSTTTELFTVSDHWCFYCEAQSPCSTELISAYNMFTSPS
tara:strand:+ start:442 stop:1011 length:570 start_codon:yes stop_codon:yes gene_type:complete